jgi:hypothetical protein
MLALSTGLRTVQKSSYLSIVCCIFFNLMTPAGVAVASAASSTQETLVFVRHGEKPATGENGQLTCQGENRANALPQVLLPTYGIPDFIFAAAPVLNQDDNGVNYYYLRAMATIEPTAIAAGLTIDLTYDKDDISDLEKELAKSQYATSTVFVAWEHTEMDELVANIVHDNGGDSSVVPSWPDDDYDSIFVVDLITSGGSTSVTFTHNFEGLNGRSLLCPTPSRYPTILRP